MREVYDRVAISIMGNNIFGTGIKAVITLVALLVKQCLTHRPGRADTMYPVSDIAA